MSFGALRAIELCLLLACTACSGGMLSLGSTDQLIASAKEASEGGDHSSSAELYMRCFEYCPGFAPVDELSSEIDSVGALEEAMWEVVDRVESRVILAKEDTPELVSDVDRLIRLYRVRSKLERGRAFKARLLRDGVSVVYARFVSFAARLLPSLLQDFSQLDVELLVSEVESSPGRDRVYLEQLRLSPELLGIVQDRASLRLVTRSESAAFYASALSMGGRATDAKRILKAAVAGAGCDAIFEALETTQTTTLKPLLCEECSAHAACEGESRPTETPPGAAPPAE